MFARALSGHAATAATAGAAGAAGGGGRTGGEGCMGPEWRQEEEGDGSGACAAARSGDSVRRLAGKLLLHR